MQKGLGSDRGRLMRMRVQGCAAAILLEGAAGDAQQGGGAGRRSRASGGSWRAAAPTLRSWRPRRATAAARAAAGTWASSGPGRCRSPSRTPPTRSRWVAFSSCRVSLDPGSGAAHLPCDEWPERRVCMQARMHMHRCKQPGRCMHGSCWLTCCGDVELTARCWACRWASSASPCSRTVGCTSSYGRRDLLCYACAACFLVLRTRHCCFQYKFNMTTLCMFKYATCKHCIQLLSR